MRDFSKLPKSNSSKSSRGDAKLLIKSCCYFGICLCNSNQWEKFDITDQDQPSQKNATFTDSAMPNYFVPL